MANPGVLDIFDGAADPLNPPASSNLRMYPKSGVWYSETSGGTISPLVNGASSVTNSDGTLVISPTAGAVIASRTAITGDASIAGGSNISVLATVNTNTGPWGSATQVGTFTVNGKGLTTAAGNTSIQIAESQVTNLTTDLAGKQPTGNYITALTGNVTASGPGSSVATIGDAQVSNAMLADRAANSVMGNNTGSPSDTIDLTQTQLTAMINSASSSLSGAETPAHYTTIQDLWFDVTNYGVSTANSGTANVAAMNTLIQTTAPSGATFFFPDTGANYPMTGTITVTKNYQSFVGHGMRGSVIFSSNTTVDLFFLTDGVRNITFQDLGFWSTATASAGSAINCGTPSGSGNAQVNVYRCGLEGFGGTWFNGIMYNGTLAGLLCNLEDCNFNAFTHYGIGIVGNTSIPSTVSANIISNTTLNGNINGTSGATAGIFVRQCGALQIVNSDIIQCTNNLLVNPQAAGEIIASIYANNSYFDSSYGSCTLLNGSGPIVRCKFVSCSFTVSGGNNNYSAFEVNSTAANPPAGIDLLNCNIQNTFSNSGTSNGLLLTTIADIKIEGNNISGFTNGIQVTPAAAGVTRLNILGNTIGPAGGIKGNVTGILLNAGSAAYGMIQIIDNVFPPASAYGAANTTNITDNSTLGTGTAALGQKTIADNNGTIINSSVANYAATAIPLTTVTNVDSRGGTLIPVSARPSSGRISIYATNAATIQTLTATVRYGTTNASGDTAIYTHAFGAGTANVGSGHFTIDWELLTATTIGITFKAYNGNVTTTTGMFPVASYFESLATPATVVTNVNNWLGVYFSSATAAAITIRSVKYEVQSQ